MFRSLVDFGGRYIHPNDDKDKEYTEICSKHIDATVRSFCIKMGLMLLSLQGSMVGPIYAYIMHGTKTTMTNVLIPYVEHESNEEFAYNVALASIIGVHGFIGYIGLEVAMTLFSDVVTIVPKLIELNFQRLDKQIEKQKPSDWHLRHTINNTIKQALDSDEYDFWLMEQATKYLVIFVILFFHSYVTCIGNFLYYRTLVTPPLFTYAIGLTIFCQYTVICELDDLIRKYISETSKIPNSLPQFCRKHKNKSK